jgi:hypothetical protein
VCELTALDVPVLIMSEVVTDEENAVDSVDTPEDKHNANLQSLNEEISQGRSNFAHSKNFVHHNACHKLVKLSFSEVKSCNRVFS